MTRIFSPEEISEVVEMLLFQELDIRAVTLGLSIQECVSNSLENTISCIESIVSEYSRKLSRAVDEVSRRYGVRIVTKRLALTPISILLEPYASKSIDRGVEAGVEIAKAIDKAGGDGGVDYIGGYTAFVHKSFTPGDKAVVESIPDAIAETMRVSAMVNVASTNTGVNMDAVKVMGCKILETSRKTRQGLGCARLVVMANAPEDNPFMPGAYHGLGEPRVVVNVAVSGPGVIENAVRKLGCKADFRTLHDTIKRVAFKITRLGELVGRAVSRLVDAEFGIVDLSIAPSPKEGDSVARILEAMGIEVAGAPGSIAALYILVDAVRKGGAMATSSIGGLSGAFIPVSEDEGMSKAVEAGAITIDRLEAMMSVSNTGVDMVAVPGDTQPETISAIIADVACVAIALDKALGVRIIPVPGAKPGDKVDFGGLLGSTVVVGVSKFSSKEFVSRGGLIPPPVKRLERG